MQHHPGQIELMSRVCGQIHVIKDPLHDVVYTPYIPRAKEELVGGEGCGPRKLTLAGLQSNWHNYGLLHLLPGRGGGRKQSAIPTADEIGRPREAAANRGRTPPIHLAAPRRAVSHAGPELVALQDEGPVRPHLHERRPAPARQRCAPPPSNLPSGKGSTASP